MSEPTVAEALDNLDKHGVYTGVKDSLRVVFNAARRYAAGRPLMWCHYHSSTVSGSGKSAIPLVCDYGYAEDDGEACEIVDKWLTDLPAEEE